MTTSPIPKGQAVKRQARSQSKAVTITEPEPSPEQMDLFTQETERTQELCLLNEHRAQLKAQETLSQARVAAMLKGLATQLFSIWNDVWLQRQKVHDEAFKAWLKQLLS